MRSVLDQGYPELEYIVIDGGSTDRSVEIIRRYADRLAYWESCKDRGQSHAINKGMARATGDLRAYLNSDDLYLPGALHRVAEAWMEAPGAGLYAGHCITIDEAGEGLAKTYASDIETLPDALDLWRVWYRGRNFVQPEVFWTAGVAAAIGSIDEKRHFAMDYDYWCRALAAGARVRRVDADVAAFRIWAAQKSSQSERAAAELRRSRPAT